MTMFVGLRAKMYLYLVQGGDEKNKPEKGVKTYM